MEIQTQLQIHQAIEYIKQDPEFPFDTHDEPETILAHYGICFDLDADAKKLLFNEISKITSEHQTAEITRQITDDREIPQLIT